jgi:dephospho-CoA kinase
LTTPEVHCDFLVAQINHFFIISLMKLLGLTGGVGMGKSTVAEYFCKYGAQVVDTDELAHQLVEPGQSALAEIQAVFGNIIVAPDGQLRRQELAQIVFTNATARKKLEAILHPRIRERWLAQIEIWRNEGCELAVVVIPLLFETSAEPEFDKTVCVACSAASQRERLLKRGWTPDEISRRITSQLPIEQKIAQADFVVWTDGTLESTAEQVGRIVSRL